MTIDNLLDEIWKADCKEITITRSTAMHGNKDGDGDYSIVKLTIGAEELSFRKTDTGWEEET